MSNLFTETHPLHYEYTFWVTYFKKSKDKQLEEFEDNLISIASFLTIEDFWTIYERMRRPSVLPRGCEFFLFKAGIKPLWEDNQNIGGGRFYFSMKKSQLTNKIWEDLQIGLLLSEKEFEKLNGIVLNVRQSEIFISVWTKRFTTEETETYKEWLKKTLEFPNEQIIEYKFHPNNAQLIQKQELLTKEEEDRMKKEFDFEKKKVDDLEKKRTRTGPNQNLGKTTKKEAEQIAKLVKDMENNID